jgi:3-oxoadipate enol-lactonase
MENIQANISIFEKGDTKNKSIIFVHGFPYDHQMWDKVTDSLSDEYYCVTYDIRGLGNSDAGDGQYTIEMFADDLIYVIDKMKLEKPVLAGLSMGGYISLRAVEKYPDRFTALILCDTKSEADNNQAKTKRAQGIKTINEKGLESFVQEFVPTCFAEESINSLGKDYEEIFQRSLKHNPKGVKGCLLAMAGRTDTTDNLQNINIPALLICGEKDKLTPPDIMKEMSKKIKGSRFLVIPGSGHMTPVENPGSVISEIRKFLKEIL